MKFFSVVSFSEAERIIKENFDINGLKTEVMPTEKAVGYRAARDVFSNEALPEYHRSTVDGYAVKASSTYGATESIPTILSFKGKVDIGEPCHLTIDRGETAYVPTGGEVPSGADAMLMLEYTEPFGDTIAVYKPVSVRENVISIGDDIAVGEKLLSKGEVLTPLKCGALAGAGFAEIEVFSKLRVAVISTGDELVGIKEKKQKWQIRDVNSIVNCLLCQQNGFEVTSSVRIADGFELLDEAVKAALKVADIVLISGGSSIGTRDFTERVLEREGEILIHGIALKPGKPTIVARANEKLVFGLPGHPMACVLTLKLLVIGAINSAFGDGELPFVTARTTLNFPSSPGRTTVQPVKLVFTDTETEATPIFYKSGMISILNKADAYILIPPLQEGLAKGALVKAYLL